MPSSTEQEKSTAIKTLKDIRDSIVDPEFDLTTVREPAMNEDRKRRKSAKGPKSSTKRLEIYKEIFEKQQKKDIQNKEKDNKQREEYEKAKRQLEIKEMHINLEKKKRKLTVFVKDENGIKATSNINRNVHNANVHNANVHNANVHYAKAEIKTEPSSYDR
jgi:hypothetical protein